MSFKFGDLRILVLDERTNGLDPEGIGTHCFEPANHRYVGDD